MELLPDLNYSLIDLFQDVATKEQTSSYVVPRVDHITSLPPELLQLIWDHVPTLPSRSPICKAFLPFQRGLHFRRIFITSIGAFSRFFRLFDSHPHLGNYARAFYLVPAPREVRVELDTLQNVFQNMSQLRSMSIGRHGRLSEFVLSTEVAEKQFRMMDDLSLVNPFHRSALKQWDLNTYQNIKKYPSLKEFSLVVLSNEPPPPPSFDDGIPPPSPTSVVLSSTVTTFNLRGALDAYYAPKLIAAFPNLLCLSLTANGEEVAMFAPCLKAAPSSLTSLTISDEEHSTHMDDNEDLLIDDAISHLTRLESLEISTTLFSSRLFQHLKNPLPLRSLMFGEQAKDLHQDDLKKLIDPTSPLYNSTLHLLLVDVINGYIGESTARDGLDEEGSPLLEDWVIPLWVSDQLDYEGVTSLLDLALENGVHLTGSTINAIEVQEALEEEEDRAEEIWNSLLDMEDEEDATHDEDGEDDCGCSNCRFGRMFGFV